MVFATCMTITCPICKSSYELSNLSEEEDVTQCVCEECQANLVIVTEKGTSRWFGKKGPGPTASSPAGRNKPSKKQMTLTLAVVVVLCVLNYSMIGAVIYGASQILPTTLTSKKLGSTPTPSTPVPPPPQAQGKRLTKQDIESLVQRIDQAINEKNVEQVMAHMADDLTLTGSLHFSQSSQPKLFMLHRDQFETNLQKTYAMSEQYEFLRERTTITMIPLSEQAEVMSHTIERITIAGKTTQVDGKEIMMIELRDGRPLVVKVQATGHMKTL